jgi:glycosyltransferase involved in cell wall biosynthesis
MRKKKRILLLYFGGTYGGIDRVIINLEPKYFDEYEVVLASVKEEYITAGLTDKNLIHAYYRIPLNKPFKAFGFFHLLHIIIKERIDILFTLEIICSVFARFIKLFFPRIKHITCICSNFRAFSDRNSAWFIECVLLMNAKTQWLVDKYVCISEYVSRYMRNEGVLPEKLKVIHLGVHPIDEKKEKSSVFKLNRPFVVAYVGRISHEKGVDIFLDIAKKNIDSPENIKFILIGEILSLSDEINRMGKLYPDRFQATGFIDSIPWHEIDCLVVPSRDEGFSFVVLEAFARQIPVVAANRGALPEIIINDHNGVLCEFGKTDEFWRSIIKIKNNQVYRERLISNAKKSVNEHFRAERMQGEYIHLFDMILT